MAKMLDFFALLVAQKKSVLPPYLQQDAWLESTGEQWIDTGVAVKDHLIYIKSKFQFLVTNKTQVIFGSNRYNNNVYQVDCHQNRISYHGDGVVSLLYPANTLIHSIETNANGIYVDGNFISNNIGTGANSNKNYHLFSGWNNTEYASNARIHDNFKLTQDNILVRNLIPCHFKTTAQAIDGNTGVLTTYQQGKPCMYDTVNNKVYVNQGTGADFIVGPAVPFQYNQLIPDGQINKSITINSSPSANQLDPYILIKDPSLVGHKVYAKITTSNAKLRVGWYKSLNTGYDFATGTEITANSQVPTATEGIYEITQDMVHSGTNYLQLYFFKGAGVQTGTHNITIQLVDLTALGMQNITNTVLFKATDLGKYLDAGNTLEFTGTTNKTYNS